MLRNNKICTKSNFICHWVLIAKPKHVAILTWYRKRVLKCKNVYYATNETLTCIDRRNNGVTNCYVNVTLQWKKIHLVIHKALFYAQIMTVFMNSLDFSKFLVDILIISFCHKYMLWEVCIWVHFPSIHKFIPLDSWSVF